MINSIILSSYRRRSEKIKDGVAVLHDYSDIKLADGHQ